MPPRKGPESEDEADLRPLQPWEIARIRGVLRRDEFRTRLRGIVWKTMTWGALFFALLSSFKEQVLAWFGKGGP